MVGSKNPMTVKGFQKLRDEYEHLSSVERPKVVRGVADAAAEGDRSENAEYIYGKKRLREIDKRLQYLSRLLKDVQVIDPANQKGDKVCFGAKVTVMDEEGQKNEWMIVGDGEADAREGTISWKSPMARALQGKEMGEIVVVERPVGDKEYEISAIIVGVTGEDA